MVERDISPLDVEKPRIFYGYIIVAAVFFVLGACTATMYSFGVFFKSLEQDFGWTRVMTAGAYSLYAGLNGSLAIVMGGLTDRFGPRLVLTGSGLLIGTGFILMSRISDIWQLYLFYGVIVALGMSAGTIPALSLIARWFIKRRALMTGIVMAANGIGGMVTPPLANWLITDYDWRFSYVVLGCITMLLIVAAAQFLRRDPSRMGLLPYGAKELGGEAGEDSSRLEAGAFSLRQAVHTRQFWLICALSFFFTFASGTILVHIIIAATGLGASAASAAAILSIYGGMQFIGRLGWSINADRIGSRQVLMFGFLLMAVALLWLVFTKELWMFYLFAVVYGFAAGCWVVLPPLVGETFGMMSHGVFIGFAYFSSNVGMMIGPVMAARIFDTTGSYQLAWGVIAVAGIMSLTMTLLIRRAGSPMLPDDGKRGH